jgi:hypothetical protein
LHAATLCHHGSIQFIFWMQRFYPGVFYTIGFLNNNVYVYVYVCFVSRKYDSKCSGFSRGSSATRLNIKCVKDVT